MKGKIHEHQVFPAYAGMSPPSETASKKVLGFPRLRGDEPTVYTSGIKKTAFSPPTRG